MIDKLGLKGSIPTEIEKLSNLQYLILFENQISGQIPSQLGKLDNLVNLDFYSNSLEGEIPEELYDLSGLILLHCGKNDLNGTLSEKIRNMGQLQVLYLFQNELSGIIPESISDLNSTLGKSLCFLCHGAPTQFLIHLFSRVFVFEGKQLQRFFATRNGKINKSQRVINWEKRIFRKVNSSTGKESW